MLLARNCNGLLPSALHSSNLNPSCDVRNGHHVGSRICAERTFPPHCCYVSGFKPQSHQDSIVFHLNAQRPSNTPQLLRTFATCWVFPITPDHPYHRYHSFLQLAGFWLFRWSAPPRARAAMARSACTNRALQIIYRSAPHRECTGPWGDSATFGSFMSFERCPCGVRFLLAAHPGSCASIPTVQRWQSQVRELRAACGPRIAATDTQGGKRN